MQSSQTSLTWAGLVWPGKLGCASPGWPGLCWVGLGLLHHFFQNKFKLVQRLHQFLIYCSTFSKQVQTCTKHDAIKSNYCITGMGWPDLGWLGLAWHAGLARAGLARAGLPWPGLGWAYCIIFSKQVQICSKHDAIK